MVFNNILIIFIRYFGYLNYVKYNPQLSQLNHQCLVIFLFHQVRISLRCSFRAEKITSSNVNNVPNTEMNLNSQGIQGTLPSRHGSVEKQLGTDSFSHSQSQSGTVKNTMISRKSFALQDKVMFILILKCFFFFF